MKKTAIIALGGNALSQKKEAGTMSEQFNNTRNSFQQIMEFVREDYNICLTHGNGPQVGDELLRMDLTRDVVPPIPLGICVAGTQGTIGYMIQQTFQNALRDENIDKEVVTMVTQVIVNKDDPSFQNPTKFVGKRYSFEEAEELARNMGWDIKEQEAGQWRRVVPSPDPEFVMHGHSIRTLVESGTIVIAAGGGGIPVYNTTDIDQVYKNFNTPEQSPIRQMTDREAKKLQDDGHFQQGSMWPKIRSAIHFLKHHGEKAVITNIANIQKAIEGKAGTTIIKE
jgi:carbamate kinase